MKQFVVPVLFFACMLISCNRNKMEHDASGTFESTEIVVSSEVTGKIENFNLSEGDQLKQGQLVGNIDTIQLYLKKLQMEASAKSVVVRKPDIALQVASTRDQIRKDEIEKQRIQNLLRDGASTQKQLDDINSQLDVLRSSLSAQMNSLSTSVKGLDKESSVYLIQVAQVEDDLRRSRIVSPIDGSVLTKYVEPGEMIQSGKPMFKIADTKHLYLKAYVISDQLPKIKVGQKATVYINGDEGKQKSYTGKVTWIADEAEFTPKTIQTQDERQNLVYAVKIAVDNSAGAIKIGMYGDVDF